MLPEHKKQIHNPKAQIEKPAFGRIICTRRRQLQVSQTSLAKLIKVSDSYMSRLESGLSRPSIYLIMRLAEELALDSRQLLAVVNPSIAMMIGPDEHQEPSFAWDEFRNNTKVTRLYNVTSQEIDLLSKVATMGRVSSARDFIYILLAVRNALAKY
jgi:transcriptional regulator with XRE-family HTH domain